MAFEGYSPRARQVIFIARHIAGRRGSSLIHLQHLLLAIIYEDQGEIWKVLSDSPELQHLPALPSAGSQEPLLPFAKASDLIRSLEGILPQDQPLASSASIPMSSEVKEALAIAGEVVTKFGQKQVEPVHLVAALLRERSGHSAALLRQAGLSEEQVMEAIRRFSGPP